MPHEPADQAPRDFGDEGTAIRRLRRFLSAILLFTTAGTFVELVLLDHYEDWWQRIPLVLLGLTAVVLFWHGVRGGGASVRAVQVVMGLLVAGSIIGMVLHYRASAAYFREMDPTTGGWPLVSKVLHSKAPPALAPGVLLQMGLIGLAFTYRHPALNRRHVEGESA